MRGAEFDSQPKLQVVDVPNEVHLHFHVETLMPRYNSLTHRDVPIVHLSEKTSCRGCSDR